MDIAFDGSFPGAPERLAPNNDRFDVPFFRFGEVRRRRPQIRGETAHWDVYVGEFQ
jgi:hypothetical protein